MRWTKAADWLPAWFRGSKVHTAKQGRRRRIKLGVEQLETRAVPATFNAADFGSIQAAIDAAAANSGDDVVQIDPGTYFENLIINDSSGDLTLQGLGEVPSAVVINGSGLTAIDAVLQNDVAIVNLKITGSSDGVSAQSPAAPAEPGDLLLWAVEAVGNSSDGLIVSGASNVSILFSSLSENGDEGAEISSVGNLLIYDTTLSNNGGDGVSAVDVNGIIVSLYVVADLNAGSGANIRNAGSFVDLLSSYSQNDAHGIVLFDTADDVILLGTVCVGNDADRFSSDFTGAGVRMADTATDSDDVAVGGDLIVVDAEFNNNRTGLYSSGRIGGNVYVDGVTANENQLEGIRFQNQENPLGVAIAGDLTIIDSHASGNGSHGVFVQQAVAGNVYIDNLTATNNGFGTGTGSGLFIAGAGEVFICGGDFSGNKDDGIHIENATSVTLTEVTSTDNGDDIDDYDLETVNVGDLTIDGGSIENISP